MLKKNMQKEIEKYQGNIFYFDNTTKNIKAAEWIQTLNDYNHYEFELHHFVPFTDWKKNTKNIKKIVKENKLILLPKKMHQHLENPIYKLKKDYFEYIYGINPDLLLFDINSKNISHKDSFEKRDLFTFIKADKTIPSSANFLLTEEDLSCFDEIYKRSLSYA